MLYLIFFLWLTFLISFSRLPAVCIWYSYFSSWKYCTWKSCSCRWITSSGSFWPFSFEKGETKCFLICFFVLLETKLNIQYYSLHFYSGSFNIIRLGTHKGDIIILKCYLQMIITEASKIAQDVSNSGKLAAPSTDVESVVRTPAATEASLVLRSPSKSLKVMVTLLSCILAWSHP